MKKRPRIAWVIPTLSVGGTEIQLLHLMQGLKDEFELTLVCTRGAGALIGDARRCGAYVRVVETLGGWDPTLTTKLERQFRAHTPHIVHTFLFGFDYWANIAARRAGARVIISSRRELAHWQRRRHIFIQRRGNRLVDAIIANSNAVRDSAIRRENADPARFHVIRNGIRAENFQTNLPKAACRERFRIPPRAEVVGMIANFSPVKDHKLFVDMAAIIATQRQAAHFLLVGAGPTLEPTLRYIEQRGLLGRFHRLASLGDIAPLYAAMDVAVLTSEAEGSPNVIPEAMAAARPVVAAAVGGIPELIQHENTGILVSDRTPEAFATAVISLLDDASRREQLATAAKSWVLENITVEQMVASHRKLYKGLLTAKYPQE